MDFKSLLSMKDIKGFEFTEVMEGYHYMPAVKKESMPLKFTLKWGTENLKDTLNPNSNRYLQFAAAGILEADGIVTGGTRTFGLIHLNYPENIIQYMLQFKSAERPPVNDYVLVGEKMNIKWYNLPYSHTTCYTTIVNGADQLISRGVAFFKMKNALSFIKSFKIYK